MTVCTSKAAAPGPGERGEWVCWHFFGRPARIPAALPHRYGGRLDDQRQLVLRVRRSAADGSYLYEPGSSVHAGCPTPTPKTTVVLFPGERRQCQLHRRRPVPFHPRRGLDCTSRAFLRAEQAREPSPTSAAAPPAPPTWGHDARRRDEGRHAAKDVLRRPLLRARSWSTSSPAASAAPICTAPPTLRSSTRRRRCGGNRVDGP